MFVIVFIKGCQKEEEGEEDGRVHCDCTTLNKSSIFSLKTGGKITIRCLDEAIIISLSCPGGHWLVTRKLWSTHRQRLNYRGRISSEEARRV